MQPGTDLASTPRHVDVQLVEKGGGSVGAGKLALDDTDLQRGSGKWLTMLRPEDKEGGGREGGPRVQLVLGYRGPEVAYPRGAVLESAP
eukprot:3400982-Rhodomonas_salina.1